MTTKMMTITIGVDNGNALVFHFSRVWSIVVAETKQRRRVPHAERENGVKNLHAQTPQQRGAESLLLITITMTTMVNNVTPTTTTTTMTTITTTNICWQDQQTTSTTMQCGLLLATLQDDVLQVSIRQQ